MLATLTIFFSLSALTIGWLRRSSWMRPPLPPGPPADPIIGHLRLIPSQGQEKFFYEMGKKYGSVVHLHVLGRPMIVLNSFEAASDLLDKKGAKYSDRQDFPVYKLMGFVHHLVFLKYGREFQIQRKLFQDYFARKKCEEYNPIQTREARVLVQSLMSNPDEHEKHLIRFATAVIIRIAYGHQLESDDDPYLKMMEDFTTMIAHSGPPGGTPVDAFPMLQYFPSWFPGTFYANFARNAQGMIRQLYQYPYEQTRKQMANGTVHPSFLASHLEALDQEGSDDDDGVEIIKGAAAVVYFAGAETTSSTLAIFLLAMVLYPECQATAQEELDRVLGPGRLPEFNDRESLPYLESLIQETIRWNQAAPAGIPHRSLEDDIYNGMFIPKGSMIIANTRGMTLDEDVYKDPCQFNPMRYIQKPQGRGEPHPTAAFGFGRRICPGRYLALDNVWIAVATILMTLSIQKAIGDDGNEITPGADFEVTGATCHPCPFQCRIRPRTDAAKYLVSQIDITDFF